MNTPSLHLTDMSRELKSDNGGHYRRQLSDTLTRYQRQLASATVPENLKTVLSHILQAVTHAQTILTTEEA
jgi:hypothetical protein